MLAAIRSRLVGGQSGRHHTQREGTAKKLSDFRNCRTFGAARDLADDLHRINDSRTLESLGRLLGVRRLGWGGCPAGQES